MWITCTKLSLTRLTSDCVSMTMWWQFCFVTLCFVFTLQRTFAIHHVLAAAAAAERNSGCRNGMMTLSVRVRGESVYNNNNAMRMKKPPNETKTKPVLLYLALANSWAVRSLMDNACKQTHQLPHTIWAVEMSWKNICCVVARAKSLEWNNDIDDVCTSCVLTRYTTAHTRKTESTQRERASAAKTIAKGTFLRYYKVLSYTAHHSAIYWRTNFLKHLRWRWRKTFRCIRVVFSSNKQWCGCFCCCYLPTYNVQTLAYTRMKQLKIPLRWSILSYFLTSLRTTCPLSWRLKTVPVYPIHIRTACRIFFYFASFYFQTNLLRVAVSVTGQIAAYDRVSMRLLLLLSLLIFISNHIPEADWQKI